VINHKNKIIMSILFRLLLLPLLIIDAGPFVSICSAARVAVVDRTRTTAITKNGTYEGLYLPSWSQVAFLGMPYAKSPVGALRYKWAQSLNTSFSEVRNATRYGYSCMQYGTAFDISEDCLTVNVIRPVFEENESKAELLPVL
jgi:hypothetical protein